MKKMSVDDALAHYGVKGMKWGVRRDQAILDRISGRRTKAVGGTREDRKKLTSDANKKYKEYKDSTTRKERKADRKQAIAERASWLVDEAMKNPERMIHVSMGQGSVPRLASGKEFVNHLSRGGAFDPKYTDITDIVMVPPKTKK